MNSATSQYQRASDLEDVEALILDHLDYARKIFGSLSINIRDEDEQENLYSAGIVGLIQAAKAFDPSRGVSFQTYSYPRIRGAILDELRKNTEVSQRVLQQIRQINEVYSSLEPPVTPEALSAKTGLSLDHVFSCLEAMRFLNPTEWVDLNCTVHSSWNHNTDCPVHTLERSEMKQILADGIEQLPEKERLVLTLYYTEELTLEEIGEVVDLSGSRVSRLLSSAKFRLQEFVRSKTS